MTRPACLDGGRVVALGGSSNREASLRLLVLAAAALAPMACQQKVSPAGASDPIDAAAVSTTRSALVTNPASWQNLWGSWPQNRYDEPIVYDSTRKILVTFGGRATTQGPYYDDTWEWDGARASWNEKTPAGTNPAERSGHMMVYDPVHMKTFLFSGWQPGAGFYIPEQWVWDGPTGTWTQINVTGATPTPRYGGTLVWDSDRQRAVLFGGFDEATGRRNDVWEWDGSTWVDRTPATGTKPPGRWGHAAAYDSVRKKMVVYGGNTGTGLASAGSFVDETWEWDGTAQTWTKITTNAGVVYYYYGGYQMGFDASRGKIVLFYNYNNVYEYDPTTPSWTAVTAPMRSDTNYPGNPVAMTYDSDRKVMVIFGGQYNRDLWEYDGNAGTLTDRSAPVNGPIQRSQPQLAFDAKAGKLMLFGGYSNIDGLYKQDTWQWSGTDATWTNRTNANTKPPARRGGMMVYDSKRDQLVLFGGYGANYYNDVWTWTSSTGNWTQQTITGTQPSATYNNTMFYDSARDKILLFINYYTIWELDPATWKWTSKISSYSVVPQGFSQRGNYQITFDTDRSKMLFVAGYGYMPAVGNVYDADVWEWDPVTSLFNERAPATGAVVPAGRYSHGVSYDSARRVVVMFGGYEQVTGGNNGAVNDSWEWDGVGGIWTETTPPGVKPLARYNHIQIFDSVKSNTLVFGGTVPDDTTYGPQEIWQYVASTAPRPNGSGCSVAAAATCASGNCVDGVCCAQTAAQCNGMCKACNVASALGTCSNVPVGQTDDTCASGQVCNATQQCKAANGAACSMYSDCASGHCADGVCCDTDCNGTCTQCNLPTKIGVCSTVPNGFEDPGTCTSDATQPRFCDGTGTCSNAPKATGKPCTASGQCASTFCIDGFCCGSACNNTCYTCGKTGSEGYCTPIAAGLPDHSATTTCDAAIQYCNGYGTCAMDKKPNGLACTTSTDCGSGFCVDGICCNSACTATCQACNVTGSNGVCVNVKPGSQDLNSTPPCNGAQYCDSSATCQSGLKTNGLTCGAGTECGSGNCVDGVCCDSACTDDCYACNLTGTVGTCSGVPAGVTDGNCKSPNYCDSQHACTMGKKANGATCTLANECGSGNCVDGVCCDSACSGTCQTCSSGTCQLVADGMDPRKVCNPTPTNDTNVCKGVCNGAGACRYPASGTMCAPAGCQMDTGYITDALMCDGSGNCGPPANLIKPTKDCNGFHCFTDAQGMAQCGTDCTKDPDCASNRFCQTAADGGVNAACPPIFDNGHACIRDKQCASGACSDGVCCNISCNRCGTCNMPGSVGTCIPVAAGTDPNHDCIDSASDPTGKCGGMCDGHAQCLFPQAGASCGTCKTCNGSGLCNIPPDDDDACGTISCSGLNTSCSTFHDLTAKRCAGLGACKTANNAATCTDVTSTCAADGGAGTGGGGTTGTGGAGTGGATGAAGGKAGTDGGADAKAGGSSGGGCGCVVGGSGLSNGLSMTGLLLGAVLAARRRRRR